LAAVPVVAWDERLSSVQAERALREMGVSTRATKRGEVDRLAAVFILQSYLDSITRTR
jgi:putative Holliday junction resolvase